MDQMKRRNFVGQVAGIAGMVGLGSAMALSPRTAEAQTAGISPLIVPLTGAVNGVPATGTFAIRQFANQAGQLVATGVATLTTGGANPTTTVFPVAIPIPNLPAASGTCTVLTLNLGPLDLTLLGLVIHLNPIVLNITADPAGGLLGQLLCSLAGGTPLSNLIATLNNILRQL